MFGLSFMIAVISGCAIIITYYGFRRKRKWSKKGFELETLQVKMHEIEIERLKQELEAKKLDLNEEMMKQKPSSK
jgi:hypothetical protein